MILAPVTLQRVSHGIKAGIHSGARRYGDCQLRIDDCSAGHEGRVIDGALLFSVADDGNLGHFAAGACCCGHCDYGKALGREGKVTVVIVQKVSVTQGSGSGKLCRIDGTAASDADYGICLKFPCKSNRFNCAAELRILFNATENSADPALRVPELLCLREEMMTADQNTASDAEL